MLTAEQHSAQCNVAFYSEHGGVSMIAGEVGRVFVIVDDWQVNQRSQDARSKNVPEIDTKDEQPDSVHNNGLLSLDAEFFGPVPLLPHLPCIEGKQKQGQNLKGREDASKRNDTGRFGDPVEVVRNANCCSDKKEHHREKDNAFRHQSRDKPHLDEHVADYNGCEYLESNLNPHMNDHPAPIVRNGEIHLWLHKEAEEQEHDHDCAAVKKP